ncbi:MAG: thiamine diphosphokinase [Oligoflexales bacterium]
MILPTETILVLGGELSGLAAKQIQAFDPKRLIAVDQAYHKLQSFGLAPDFLIGDFDSVDGSKIACDIAKIETHNQDMTDFEKSIHFIREQCWGRTSIFGIGGGELDHIIGNIQVLVKNLEYEDEFYFFDYFASNCKIGCLVNKRLEFHSYLGAKISLFPYPKATVNSHGLKYKLSKQVIFQNRGILATRNELIEPYGVLEVLEGLVLCIFDAQQGLFPKF